jgi:hypothetical protein
MQRHSGSPVASSSTGSRASDPSDFATHCQSAHEVLAEPTLAFNARLAPESPLLCSAYGAERQHYELARVVNHEDGTAIHQVKSLTRAEYESVSGASNLLTELFRGFNIYVRISLDNLEEEIVAGNRRLSAESKLDYTDKSRLLYMALCVSVAIKMYEEHVHSGINRRWGKESIQSKEARRLFSLTFDDSLEYRVMYALRNALAHSSTEVLNLKYSGRLSDPNDGSSDPVTSIKIGLSRTAFANADVRAETKREVARLAEDPDLLEYS